jgi:hypothetical protein
VVFDLVRAVSADIRGGWVDLNDRFAGCTVGDRIGPPRHHVMTVFPRRRTGHRVAALAVEESAAVRRQASLPSHSPRRAVGAAAVAARNELVGAIFFAVVADPAIAAFAVGDVAVCLETTGPMVAAIESIARVALSAERIRVRVRAAGEVSL